MTRLASAALLVGLITATAARADVAPAKGLKRLPLEHHIATEKDFPDLDFFAVSGDQATPLKLDAKTPATVRAGGGRFRVAELVAVPKDAAKSYPTEKEFRTAVAGGKVPGTVRAKTVFTAFTEVKDSDPRKVGVMKYKLEKIDEKAGLVVVQVKDEPKPEEEEARNAPASRPVALGLALAGCAGFAGLVVARRRNGPGAAAR